MDKVDKFLKIVKEEGVAIANNASDGNIAGLPPDDPPGPKKRDELSLFGKLVRRKKKNKSCEQGKYGRWITAAINAGKKKGKLA